MKKILIFMLSLTTLLALSPVTFADDHAQQATMEGSFTTVMVSAPNIGRYIASMKRDSAPFESMGATAAGYCITMSGQDYPGQMRIWTGFSNVTAAMVGATKYNPSTTENYISKLREVKHSTTWKPLKPFKLAPGYERVQSVKVAPENVPAFVAAMSNLEKALQEGGHPSFTNGVFLPIGGGTHDINTLMLRSITPTPELHGAMFDEYFAGTASWAEAYLSVGKLIMSLESDNFEICEQIYSAS
ncbi:MAG: hypothetical protein P8P22_04125 [Porticoccaceae bacterium]|nr:hypothetical protein [Porticoccaceae bacterium]MDG1307315.1 hypothetical protein [Porticoccaceae bacterium]